MSCILQCSGSAPALPLITIASAVTRSPVCSAHLVAYFPEFRQVFMEPIEDQAGALIHQGRKCGGLELGPG